MDLKKEQEYVKSFFEQLTDTEFVDMLETCGNEIILPTKEIYFKFLSEGLYREESKYNIKSGYQISKKYKTYKKYDKRFWNEGQGAAA